MAFAGEQPRGRVEPHPARAGDVDLGPGVEIGEIFFRAREAVERLHVRDELDEIARDEARREPEMAEDLHQEPPGVAARARGERERLVGRLHPGGHAHEVLHLLRKPQIERHQEVDDIGAGPEALPAEVGQPPLEERAGWLPLEVGRELRGELRRVVERELLGPTLDEEVERVDHRHIGHQVDGDVERAGRLRENEARDVVAVGVLLPVHKMLLRRDPQAVTRNRGAAVRRRAQAHLVRRQPDRAVERVERAVLEGDADRHCESREGERARRDAPAPAITAPGLPSMDPGAGRTPAAAPRPTGGGSS